MTFSDNIIVLRTIKYGERDLILQCFSQNEGRKALFIRRAGKSMAPLLFPLNVLECQYEKRTSGMGLLKECDPVYRLDHLRTDIYKYAIAQYIAELINKTMPDNMPDKDLFGFTASTAAILNELESNFSNIHLYFTAKYCIYLGFKPMNNMTAERCRFSLPAGGFTSEPADGKDILDERLSGIINTLISGNESECLELRTNSAERTRILDILIRYMSIHGMSDIELKTMDVLKDVFA